MTCWGASAPLHFTLTIRDSRTPSETLSNHQSSDFVSVCSRSYSPLFPTFFRSFISFTFYSISQWHRILSFQTISSHSKSSKKLVALSSYLSSKSSVSLLSKLRNSQPSSRLTKLCLLSLLTNTMAATARSLNYNQRRCQSDIVSFPQHP